MIFKKSIARLSHCLAALIVLGWFTHLCVAEEALTVKPLVHPLFASHMVLQRGKADPVWGWTKPGETVTVNFKDKTVQAIADASGRWEVKVGPFKTGGPYLMTIRTTKDVLVLSDILIGDVWVCSGQSNMEFGIGNLTNAPEEIQKANYPQIRLFGLPKYLNNEPQALFGPTKDGLPAWSSGMVQWNLCTPQNIQIGNWSGFSAVGYFFGRALYQNLNVPIGLIQTTWGGTICEAWVSGEALEAMPDFKNPLKKLRQEVADEKAGIYVPNPFDQQMAKWYATNDIGSAPGEEWSIQAFDDRAWKTMRLPTYFELAGLPDFDGIVWFRKEVDLPENWAGKKLELHLGPIDDRDTTFFNGVKVGARNFYDQSRDYVVPGELVKAGHNVIAVRVLDTGGYGGLYGKPEQMHLDAKDVADASPISLATEWRYQDSLPLAKAAIPPPTPSGPGGGNPNVVTVLFNGMISPLLPFGIKGAIWYQGESNAGRGRQYQSLLPIMIQDWRNRFECGDFPFFIVQLAAFNDVTPEPGDSNWAEIREAQQLSALKVGNSATASAMDLGNAKDIHPKNKPEVGRRLALCAEAITYGERVEYQGPTFKKVKYEGNQAIVEFTHARGGLVVKGESLQGFALAGEDGKFFWAHATIKGHKVVVSAAQVAQVKAVRYAWADNPVANLYNKAGLPANSFRTDSIK
jgi:sialate O-acetylesterase